MDGADSRPITSALGFAALRARLKAATDAAEQLHAATDLVATHGDRHEPYKWLVEAHWRLGDLAAALAAVDLGLARFPKDLRLLDYGRRFAKAQGDTDLAIAYCLRRAMIPSERREADAADRPVAALHLGWRRRPRCAGGGGRVRRAARRAANGLRQSRGAATRRRGRFETLGRGRSRQGSVA